MEKRKVAPSKLMKLNGSVYPSVADLAKDLGMCEKSVRVALQKREIPHIRVGKRYILPHAAIAEWLKQAGGQLREIA